MSVIKYMFSIHNECNKIYVLYSQCLYVFTMSVIKYLFCIHNEYNKIYVLYSQ